LATLAISKTQYSIRSKKVANLVFLISNCGSFR